MTDSATLVEWLRDMADFFDTEAPTAEPVIKLREAAALLVSQSSWAKEKEELTAENIALSNKAMAYVELRKSFAKVEAEKEELERQLAEADRAIWHDHAIKSPDDAPDHYDESEQRIVDAIERHASRPVTAKE